MRYFLPLLLLTTLTSCFAETQRPAETLADAESKPIQPSQRLISEPDRGEQDLVNTLFSHARNADTDGAMRVVSEHVKKEAKAIHGGMQPWLATMSDIEYTFSTLYGREGANGRWQIVEVKQPTGTLKLGFYITQTASGSAKEIDNVLSTQAVIPQVQPALASSRTNVLRAFWAYYGAMTAQAPEYLPEQSSGAPMISQRLQLAAFRTSTSPALRQRLLQSGPDRTRKHVPGYLAVMNDLLGSYNQPEVRKADLKGGTAVLLFTPTESALQQGRAAFMLEFTSGWYHGMQVLTSERKFVSS